MVGNKHKEQEEQNIPIHIFVHTKRIIIKNEIIYVYIPIYWCAILSRKKMESASMSSNRWMDKENVVHIHKVI